ncbi:MAG: YybS family protein [Bacillota bacterium]|jgi:uncharacterized protein YybS (DUF2232 family)
MEQNQEPINNPYQNNKSPLAPVALMVAMAVILGLAALILPIIGIIASFLYSLPFAIIVFRYNLRWGVIALLATTVILALLLNPLAAGLLTLQYGILGLFFGQCFRSRIKPLRILVLGVIIAALLFLATLLISAAMAGVSLDQFYAHYTQMAEKVIDSLIQGRSFQGTSIEDYKAALTEQFMHMIPAVLVIYSMVLATLEYFILVKITRRLQHDILPLPPFEGWRLTWQLVWVLIIVIIFNALSKIFDWSTVLQITSNIIYVYYPILVVCGLSLVYWMWKRFKNNSTRAIFMIVAILFMAYFVYLLMIIAVIDPIFDLRNKLKPLLEKE